MIAPAIVLAAALRIVSLSPATTEDLFVLGAANEVVAIDDYATRPPQIRAYPRVGGIDSANAEAIVAERPTVVVFQEPDTSSMEALRRAHLNVAAVPYESLADDWTAIRRVGAISGREPQARALVTRLRTHIARRAARLAHARRLRVLVVLGDSPVYSVAKGTYVDELLAAANLTNVAHDAGTPWPALSPEVVAEANPDVILVVDAEGGLTPSRIPWSLVPAVREGRVVHLREDLDCGPYVDRLFDEIDRAVSRYRDKEPR